MFFAAPQSAMKTILVGTDFSPLASVAVETAFALARRTGAKRVHVVHVMDQTVTHAPYPFAYAQQDIERVEARRQKLAQERLDEIESSGLEVTREIRHGVPSRDLAAAAREVDAGLIVVSSHGYGAIRRVLLGSVASALIRTADAPVLVVGADRRHLEFETVVAGVDLSPVSKQVLDLAARFTSPKGRLHVVSSYEVPMVVSGDEVLPHLPTEAETKEIVETRTKQIRALMPEMKDGPTVAIEPLPKAPAAMAILESAEILRADLVVIGTSGHNAWHRMILGSTATRVLSDAACPVLVVPSHPA